MGTDLVCLRVQDIVQGWSDPVPGETILLMEHLEDTPVHSGHIKEWTKRDPILSRVLRFILEG